MIKKCFPTEILRGNRGFSLIELMMILAIIAILSQISFSAWIDYRRKAYDATAVSDARNLLEAVINDMVGGVDVKYDHNPDDGSRIGVIDNNDNSKKPTATLSPGVKARIIKDCGSAYCNEDDVCGTRLYAYVWHPGGTPWGGVTNADDVREFQAIVDEPAEKILFIGLKPVEY